MIKALIFDLDGTLVDTLGDIAVSMNAALAAQGFPTLPTESYRNLVGWGLKALARSAIPESERSEEAVARCYADALAAYLAAPVVYSIPYPEIPQLLDEVAGKKIPFAVHTNKPEQAARTVVEGIFPGRPFAFIRGERPGVPRKPDPTAALEIAASLGVSREDVLYMGDSGIDMETAKAAGFFAVGAAWGFRERTELADSGADAIIDRPLALLRYL